MTRTLLTLALLGLLCVPARADVLILKGGGRIEGVVTEKGERFVVTNRTGRAEIPKTDVASRIEAPYVTEVYERRLAGCEPGDAEARYELSLWCREKGLDDRARESLLAAIEIDPDHAAARAALGHVRYGERWMPREDADRVRRQAAGLVEFEGRWFTPEGLEAWLDAKRELAELRVREEETRRRVEEEERRRREKEERLRREEEERRARAAALARAEQDRRERERLARQNEDLRDLVRELLLREERRTTWYIPWTAAYPRTTHLSPWGVRPLRPHRSGLGLDFRWTGDDFEVRGRVR